MARPATSEAPQPSPVASAARAASGRLTLDGLRARVEDCRACELWAKATQAVPGEGPASARIVLVGEQPGDREDLAGEPFVGPAGRILGEALAAAGIDRERVFLTNVVKHFRWRPAPGSKRRLHERPGRTHVRACFPWLEAELAIVRPEAVVALGAVASEALFGPGVQVTRDHGAALHSVWAPVAITTIHPSAVLRARSSEARAAMQAGLVADLRVAIRLVDGSPRRQPTATAPDKAGRSSRSAKRRKPA